MIACESALLQRRAAARKFRLAPRTVLFGAAHQLDAWLRGLHQAAIGGEIVERHAVCGEAGLELLSDRMSAQPGQTTDGGDRAGFILDDKARQSFVDDFGD